MYRPANVKPSVYQSIVLQPLICEKIKMCIHACVNKNVHASNIYTRRNYTISNFPIYVRWVKTSPSTICILVAALDISLNLHGT